MAALMIVCPETRQEVFNGIETEEASFERLPDVPSRTLCPACGREHVWTPDHARLSGRRLKQVA
jgi:hypothetical protein